MTSFEKAAPTLVVLMTLAGATWPEAGAATVYRCGNAYAGVPCPGATVVAADDARTLDEAAAAREVAARQKALAARMEADRQRAEARPVARLDPTVKKHARANTLAVAPPPSLGWTGRRRRLVQDNGQGDFVAFVPRVSAGSAKK